ncbi:MAG: hypothetical protein ABI868_10285 [Acidobacteriota bacterium]
MSNPILAASLALGLAFSIGVSAQSGPPRGRGPGPGMRGGGPGLPGIDILGVEPIEFGEPILDLPFSADAVTDMTQTLPDGNRIERRSTSTLARDSVGRTRREQALPPIGPIVVEPERRMITISDPTQRVHYLLDPVRKMAIKSTVPSSPRSRGELPSRGTPNLPRPEITSIRLGTRPIAGLQAEGTRETLTIPAARFGNVRAIDVVTERWYAADLKVVVESRRTDPRDGTVLYQLFNIVRLEPAASLFQVPPDYTVVDSPRPSPGPPRRN